MTFTIAIRIFVLLLGAAVSGFAVAAFRRADELAVSQPEDSWMSPGVNRLAYAAMFVAGIQTIVWQAQRLADGSPIAWYGPPMIIVWEGLLLAWFIQRAKHLSTKVSLPLRVLGAGITLGVLFALGRITTGKDLMLGPGYEAIHWALDPDRAIGLLLLILMLRVFATGATVAGGGVGGLFIPLVVAGALLGRAAGGIVDRADDTLFTILGVAAFLGAGYRVPLAAVMFVAETTGRATFVVPALIAAVAADLVMGDACVTSYQVGREQSLA